MASSAGQTTMKWVQKRDAEVTRDVAGWVRKNMARAGDVLKREVAQSLGGASPAPEGQPPGRRKGKLQKSIKRKVLGGPNPGVRVGPQDPEMKAILGRLQKGFTGTDRAGRNWHQQPRPVLGPALDRSRNAIMRAITGNG